MQRFLIKHFAASGFCAALIFILSRQTTLLSGFNAFCWWSLLYFFLLMPMLFLLMQRGLAMKGHSHFMQFFGAMFGLKVFASLLFVGYFIFVAPIADKNFVFPFFMMYFLFTGVLLSERKV